MASASRMSEQRITEIVRPLLVHLGKARSVAARFKKEDGVPSSFSAMDKLIDVVNGDISEVAEIIRQLEIWGKQTKDKFGDIAKDLDKALEHINDEDEYEFHSKLLNVKEVACGFKESITNDSPLHLERLEAYVNSVSSFEPSLDMNSHRASAATFESSLLQFDIKNPITEMVQNYLDVKNMRRIHILLFLSIFPTGSLIKKWMIYNWLNIGLFVISEANFDRVLGELGQMGFLKCIEKEYKPGVIDCCMLNPLVQQTVLNSRDSPYPKIYWERIYDPLLSHPFLSLSREIDQGMLWTLIMAYTPFTCFNIDHSCLKFERAKFDEMKESSVVMLGRWHSLVKHHIEVENTEFLRWLGAFKKLRYLSLRGISRITMLPPEIGELTSLYVIDLRACYDLQRLPEELAYLSNLEHLDTSECYFLSHMPKGIGRLVKLKVLKGFVVGSPQKPEPCQLDELSELDRLTKLSISIGGEAALEKREFNELKFLTSLISLTITWAAIQSPLSYDDSVSLRVLSVNELDASLPPNLVKLDLRCIPHYSLPGWLHPNKVTKLQRLYLRGGKLSIRTLRLSNLTWPNVKVLRLRFLQGADMELHNIFPNLDYLEFYKCNNSNLNHRWSRFGRNGPNSNEEES